MYNYREQSMSSNPLIWRENYVVVFEIAISQETLFQKKLGTRKQNGPR